MKSDRTVVKTGSLISVSAGADCVKSARSAGDVRVIGVIEPASVCVGSVDRVRERRTGIVQPDHVGRNDLVEDRRPIGPLNGDAARALIDRDGQLSR